MGERFWDNNLIYKVIAGSRAYGLDMPESDLNVRGVCIPPRPVLLGLSHFEQWVHKDGDGDVIIYALDKFVRLAMDCNPDVIELLYTDRQHILFINAYGEKLREHRHLFLSRQARQTFGDYAISQLRRIERQHRWLTGPPDHKPTPEEFGGIPANGRFKFSDQDAQKAYQVALKHWNQYQAWRQNRNPARAELERKHGYDTKNAMHLLRLLAMGAEILETGQVHIYRHDRQWLCAVRGGLLTYEELLDLVDDCEKRLDRLVNLSPLPEKVDAQAAEALLVELQGQFLLASP